MNYADFQKQIKMTRKSVCREIYYQNSGSIRIKKEVTVLRNLEKIFSAVLKISNKKGFQAMSMRDLSVETELSTGAMYAYFSAKEDLLNMMQHHKRTIAIQIMEKYLKPEADPIEKLKTMIRVHLYISEAMQPWFYFSYMETKNMKKKHRDQAVENSRATEKIIREIILEGQKANLVKDHDAFMSASLIKAMLQEWYLKRKKYARRKVSIDQYADFVESIILSYILN
ncbi:MAG: TetR/AcrR family transcriptional regulator [Desulfobacterales bacterium]|nr:TetR/AcrR family transcriptional regulator [Deltaproteobacteria bacterium]NNL41379.1 TetR/AcrR family transcriptional regulator [Desulfobacterales bacterium]